MEVRVTHRNMIKEQAERLKLARELAGYEKPVDFWKKHGIPQPTYYNHENGTRGMDAEAATYYAGLLKNVTAAWLLTGEGEPPPTANPPGEQAAQEKKIKDAALQRLVVAFNGLNEAGRENLLAQADLLKLAFPAESEDPQRSSKGK